MSPHRLTSTRHTPRATLDLTDTATPRHTPKRRKTTTSRDRTELLGEALAALVALAALTVALIVVAPHLADSTNPTPRDWAILLTMCAVLTTLMYLGHRTRCTHRRRH